MLAIASAATIAPVFRPTLAFILVPKIAVIATSTGTIGKEALVSMIMNMRTTSPYKTAGRAKRGDILSRDDVAKRHHHATFLIQAKYCCANWR